MLDLRPDGDFSPPPTRGAWTWDGSFIVSPAVAAGLRDGVDYLTYPTGQRAWTATGLREMQRAGWSGELRTEPNVEAALATRAALPPVAPRLPVAAQPAASPNPLPSATTSSPLLRIPVSAAKPTIDTTAIYAARAGRSDGRRARDQGQPRGGERHLPDQRHLNLRAAPLVRGSGPERCERSSADRPGRALRPAEPGHPAIGGRNLRPSRSRPDGPGRIMTISELALPPSIGSVRPPAGEWSPAPAGASPLPSRPAADLSRIRAVEVALQRAAYARARTDIVARHLAGLATVRGGGRP